MPYRRVYGVASKDNALFRQVLNGSTTEYSRGCMYPSAGSLGMALASSERRKGPSSSAATARAPGSAHPASRRRVFVYGSRRSKVLRELTKLRRRTPIAPRATARRITVAGISRARSTPGTGYGHGLVLVCGHRPAGLVPILGDTALARLEWADGSKR